LQKLFTTKEASEILGLSLQGIHYRIKKGQLQSVKKDNKLFVYLDSNKTQIDKSNTPSKSANTQTNEHISQLLLSKDEQIDILKKSIKWMKRQHFMEIKRLQKSQKRVIEVFNSEIKLLQSAFNEMRGIYKTQIAKDITINNKKDKEFINLNAFFIILKKASKSDDEIKEIIVNAIKNGDKRFIYNKKTKKLLILNDSFEDII